MEKLFAVTTPGLEPFTAQELIQLDLLTSVNAQSLHMNRPQRLSSSKYSGGVSFSGNLEAIYRLNLSLRTANRVLVRMGKFYAAAFSELRKKASRLAWDRYLVPGQPVAIRVTCRKSRLYHSDAVAERIAGAIGDCLGQPPTLGKYDEGSTAQQPQLIIVRLVRDRCTISLDSSGALLHKRGYRLETAKAPLRETLAASMLMACAWDESSPLFDPFCGSGTIPIEAAMMARGILPGSARIFAFMNWPNFDPILWKNTLEKAIRQKSDQTPNIFASDRDAGAIKTAKANAERAGVADLINFSCRSISAIEPSGTGWVVTNPPYGIRVKSNKDLRNLYAQFGNVMREKCPGWQVAVLCNNSQLLHSTRLQLDTKLSSFNGGVAVKIARGKVKDRE